MNTEPAKQPPSRSWSPEARAKLSKIMKEKHAAKAAAGQKWKPNGTGRALPQEMAKRIRELRKTDASVESIAKQLGVSESSVYKFSKTYPYRRPLTRRQVAMAHARQFRHLKKPNGHAPAVLDGMTKQEAWRHVTLWHDEYLKSQMNKLKYEIPGADQVLKALGLLP
jgi:transposase-like protein